MSTEKDRVFPSLKSGDKAERTSQAAREITERGQRASEKKTAKLKALRLARDAEAELAAAPARKAKR